MQTDPSPTSYAMTLAHHQQVVDRSLTDNEPAFTGTNLFRRMLLLHFYHVLRSEQYNHQLALEEAHRQAVQAIVDEEGTVLIP